MASLYRGTVRFDREQLVFVVESVLIGALDRLDGALPDSIDFDERLWYVNKYDTDPADVSPYERGGLEAAGMTLGVLKAQLTGDGLGIYDALAAADRFDDKFKELVWGAWKDRGAAVKARLAAAQPGQHTDDWLFGSLWPNTRACAESFVDGALGDYLGGR